MDSVFEQFKVYFFKFKYILCKHIYFRFFSSNFFAASAS